MKKQAYNCIKFSALVVLSMAYLGHLSPSFAIDVKAKSAVILEGATGKILLDKNADALWLPLP